MKLTDLFEQNTLSIDLQNSLPPTYVIPELKSSDAYMQYRHSVAIASTGPDYHGQTKKESTWGENQAVICYTPQEKEMLDQANKIMGVKAYPISNSISHENDDVNSVSPVRKFVDLTESIDHKNGTFVDTDLSQESCMNLYNWCIAHNLNCIQPDKLHVTLLYSRKPVPKLQNLNNYILNKSAKIVEWKKLKNALVLMLDFPEAHVIHKFCKKHGGTHDYNEYVPHITIDYDYNKDIPLELPDFSVNFKNIRVNGLVLNWDDKN